jgi:site-specific recombinase XerD
MRNKITTHFHLKSSTIYLRITVNGERSEISTDRKINPSSWNKVSERVNGRSEEAKMTNSYLNNLLTKVDRYLTSEDEITVHQVICDLKGIGASQVTLFHAYAHHIASMEKLEGSVYTTSTVKKYRYSFNSLQRFTSDIKLSDLNYKFIEGYHAHMRGTEGLLHNSAAKNIKNLYRVINISIRKKWLAVNPFRDFSCAFINNPRPYLNESEIEKIVSKKLPIERLAKVRDTFVFQIYTGLSFIDMQELTEHNIEIGIDGREWIVSSRKKTGNRLSIPLLPRAKAVLNKYRDSSNCRLLPVCSNQRFNGYLKEIADLCGIDKDLTSHLGRHTFATTVTLSKGVPIETVSRLLGHTSLVTTQIYAKVIDRKVADDMQFLM